MIGIGRRPLLAYTLAWGGEKTGVPMMDPYLYGKHQHSVGYLKFGFFQDQRNMFIYMIRRCWLLRKKRKLHNQRAGFLKRIRVGKLVWLNPRARSCFSYCRAPITPGGSAIRCGLVQDPISKPYKSLPSFTRTAAAATEQGVVII